MNDNSKWSILKTVAEYVKAQGTRGMPRRELGKLETAVDSLIRDGVLLEEGDHVRFFHESLFDHVLARSWAEHETDLVEAVLSTEQDLSHRSLVRQVLVYQQGTDPASYVRSIYRLLNHPDIRYHLRDVALSVVRSDPQPTKELWFVIRPLVEGFGEEGQEAAADILMEPVWFHYADSVGAVLQWAVRDDPRSLNLASSLLGVAQRRDPDRVAAILSALLPLESWKEPARWLIGGADARSSVGYMELISLALEQGIFDDGHRFTSEIFLYSLARNRGDLPWMVVRVLDALVSRWFYLAEANGEPLHDVTGQGRVLSEFLVGVASDQPFEYVSTVLPRVTRVLQQAVGSKKTLLQRDPWALRHRSSKDEATDVLFLSLSEGLDSLATRSPREFRRASRQLVDVIDTHSARFLLYSAWSACPERYANEALSHLASEGSSFECGYIDSPYWVTRELLAAIHPHLRPTGRRFLESLILNYVSDWEQSKSGRKSRGHSQFVLLDGLDASRMSAQARHRREELRRKFGPQALPPRPIQARFVPSPIPEPDAAKMNDRQWLRAMAKYHSEDGRDWLEGGVHQLASVLQAQARQDPRRFTRLAARLPDDVNEAYPSAILMGIADTVSADDTNLVFDALRRIHALPGRPGGRWIGKPLARLADTDIPSDVIEIASWYAMHDPDPISDVWLTSEDREPFYGGDPLTAGINSVRGAAAETLSALIWPRPERVPALAGVLRGLCSDRAGAVRSCAALAVLSVSKHDEDLALELFKTLVDDVDDRVLGTHYVERCVSRFGRRRKAGLVPLIRRMLTSQYPSVQEVGGRQAALMSLSRGPLDALVGSALDSGPSTRRGMAQVAAANVADESMQRQCTEWLLLLFADEDAEVRSAAADWVEAFAHAQLEETDLLGAFLRSQAFLDDPSPLLQRLDESTWTSASTLLGAIQAVVDYRLRDLGDPQTHLSGDSELIAKLAVRAYASAEDQETRTIALDQIDRMMTLRSSPMRRVVGDYE